MLTTISSINKYFKKSGTNLVFTGKKLEVVIPAMYEERSLLFVGDITNTLGVFQLRIDDKFITTIILLAKIDIEHVSHSREMIGDEEYVVLTLNTDSVFIRNTEIIKRSGLIYDIFMAFIALGKIPHILSYSAIQRLFDDCKKCCGIDLHVNHSVFEMIYAHMYRDKADPYLPYRLSDMRANPIIVPIHQISHGPDSSSARIIGSYMNEGITSSLVDDTDRPPSVVENLMR